MRSFDLKYSDMLNDDGKQKIFYSNVCLTLFCVSKKKDLPDRSCIFYVTHSQTWSTANIREFFSQWKLLCYDRLDLTTHIIAMSLEKDTVDTSEYC